MEGASHNLGPGRPETIFCAAQNGRCVSLLHDIKKLRRRRNGKLHHTRHFPFSVLLSGKIKKSLAFLSPFFDILRKPFLLFCDTRGYGADVLECRNSRLLLRGQSSLSDPRGQTRAQQQPLTPMRADKKIRTFHFKFLNLCLLRERVWGNGAPRRAKFSFFEAASTHTPL